ncbi:cytochrome c biogenesis protein CcsA [Eisenibacter elegans]|uniref:cytochrome c biogenesis protein CcsA n=1 Tax=Eisenibacter elegans TaxID=997 RepID=UPI00047ACA45|nr:cytochrome c biogenesis protein CcsA [Eisenibacter elegans]
MPNIFLGDMGHLLVIVSFVSALVVAFAYWKAAQTQLQPALEAESTGWKRFARIHFAIHSMAILGVIGILFYLIYNHHYEYHYVWSHSSNQLPIYYMISCFWEGQEGSFLLWIFWHCLLGGILIYTNRKWEAPVMTVFAAVQAFLTSMILGVVIGQLKIGSDPFILMRDALPSPIFQTNPNFVPEDGTGLNPLLQNYWMVIHPPTLFLGFAMTLVPFAYAFSGLWLRDFKAWVRPALPWAIVGAGILGLGILMGGYWAYETLNFGGYWNWDPVENAVYVPWLIMVAAIHSMIAYKQSGKALLTALGLNLATFLLILYSTFLTRSGVLGDASVHSFTDLGLSGQLLLYLLFFTFLSVVILALRWKAVQAAMPAGKSEAKYGREFWIQLGILVLCLAGLQVLAATSIPVYNVIFDNLGLSLNLAPPEDAVGFYNAWQLWFAVGIALLSGTAQFFWWKRVEDSQTLQRTLVPPLVITLLAASVVLAFGILQNLSYILLFTAGLYTVTANVFVLVNLARKSGLKLTGGAVTHIGVGLMLIGILFSSGYSKIISLNRTGKIYSEEFSTETNAENVLLWMNQPIQMQDYRVTYKGDYIAARNFPHYIRKTALMPTDDPYYALALEEVSYKGKVYFTRGDTVHLFPENTYYEVEYRDAKGRIFTLFPRAQANPQMGLLASPDIYRKWGSDLYTHVSSIPDPTVERNWGEMKEQQVRIGDTLFLNDYVAILDKVHPIREDRLMQLTANDAGLEAEVRVMGENRIYTMRPRFYIKDGQPATQSDISQDLGIRLTLRNIQPAEDPSATVFTLGVNETQKDYIIMKAMEKPLINLLWLGTLVVMAGFGIASVRRYTEFVSMRNKQME